MSVVTSGVYLKKMSEVLCSNRDQNIDNVDCGLVIATLIYFANRYAGFKFYRRNKMIFFYVYSTI